MGSAFTALILTCDTLKNLLQKYTMQTHWLVFNVLLLSSLPLALTRFEVFNFLIKTDASVFTKMPWDRMTTVCLAGWMDAELVTLAHSHDVKVVFISNYPKEHLLNNTFMAEWVKDQVAFAKKNDLDGINFDFEQPLDEGSPESIAYTKAMKDTVDAFHRELPGSQVSIDLAWAPGGIDGRYYDYLGLSLAADLVFVMGYDEQSQMWNSGPCRALANSPLTNTFAGVREYLRLGVPASKLVLGVPWYGYRYPCLNLTADNVCTIEEVPFRGCNCSDAAGRQFTYPEILDFLQLSDEGRKWDWASGTPTFNYRQDGQDYQVWYDDPQSLSIKYQIAKMMGLKGTGFWTGNFLDYNDPDMVLSMWSIIPINWTLQSV